MQCIHQADVDGETLQQALGDAREPGAGTYWARGYRQGYDENVARQMGLHVPGSLLGPSSCAQPAKSGGQKGSHPGAPWEASQRSRAGGGASSSSHSWQGLRLKWVPRQRPPPPLPEASTAAKGTFVPDWSPDVEEID